MRYKAHTCTQGTPESQDVFKLSGFDSGFMTCLLSVIWMEEWRADVY